MPASIKDKIVICVAQFDVKMFDRAHNLQKMTALACQAKKEYRPDLLIFPECANCGYNFRSKEDVAAVSEPRDGYTVSYLRTLAMDLGCGLVFGFVERCGDDYFNCAAVIESTGKTHFYHKTHLPFLGVDKYVVHGDCIQTIDTEFGPVGVMICYDLRFPEMARKLALQGARLLVLPTNLPRGGEAHPNVFTKARACENRVYVVSCNRVGEERGFCYIGRSQIVDPSGEVVGEMGENEGLMAAEIDLSLSEKKDMVVIPGEYETHFFADRRTSLYGIGGPEPN